MSATSREKNQIRRRRRRRGGKNSLDDLQSRMPIFIKTRILLTLEPQQKAKKDNYCPIYAAQEGQQLRLCVSDLEDFMVLLLPKPPFPNLGRTGRIIPPLRRADLVRDKTLDAIVVDFTTVSRKQTKCGPLFRHIRLTFFDWGIWYKRAKTDGSTVLLDCLDRACEWFDGRNMNIMFRRTLLRRHRIRKP